MGRRSGASGDGAVAGAGSAAGDRHSDSARWRGAVRAAGAGRLQRSAGGFGEFARVQERGGDERVPVEGGARDVGAESEGECKCGVDSRGEMKEMREMRERGSGVVGASFPRHVRAGLSYSAASRLRVRHFSAQGYCHLLLLSLIFLVVGRVASGQAARPSNATHAGPTFRIGGTVVNALSGEAVRNAAVRIGKSETGDTLQSVMTGEDGAFRFEGLAGGKYWLRAQARGFVDQAFDEHGGFSTGIVAGGAVDAEHLKFRLHPGASIAG